MNCNTTHYRANSSSVPGDPTLDTRTDLPPGETTLKFSGADFPPDVDEDGTVRRYQVENSVEGSLRAEIVHYNLGASISVTDDFSLGVTATYATLRMDSLVSSTATDPKGILFSKNPRIPAAGGLSDINVETRINDETDSGFAYTVGLLWHPDQVFPGRYSPLRLGFVYRKGADLVVKETKSDLDPLTGRDDHPDVFDNEIHVPDRFGVGGYYEISRWSFALDVERIKYSDLEKGFAGHKNFFTSELIPEERLGVRPSTAEFKVDDATAIHAGAQYFFDIGRGWKQFLWLGYFNAPDNRFRLDSIQPFKINGTAVAGAAETIDVYKEQFAGGKDHSHFTAGLSFHAPPPREFEIQLAADYSKDDDRQVVMSMIYRFGKLGR